MILAKPSAQTTREARSFARPPTTAIIQSMVPPMQLPDVPPTSHQTHGGYWMSSRTKRRDRSSIVLWTAIGPRRGQRGYRPAVRGQPSAHVEDSGAMFRMPLTRTHCSSYAGVGILAFRLAAVQKATFSKSGGGFRIKRLYQMVQTVSRTEQTVCTRWYKPSCTVCFMELAWNSVPSILADKP